MILLRLYKRACSMLSAPVYLQHFLNPAVGAEYSVGLWKKLVLIWRFRRNHKQIQTASHWLEHIEMAAAILRIPAAVNGDVVECGCFKGGSTANLSLVCALVGRNLIVCDSFEGLPDPEPEDVEHMVTMKNLIKVYEKGQFSGRLDEVKANISQYGCLDNCKFLQGYFEHTLHTINRDLALVYVDVDLHSSLRTCLKRLWPKLIDGGRLFSHEAQDIPYVALFFDREWWQSELASSPPGFVGSGCGIRVALNAASGLGYAVKPSRAAVVSKVIAA
jgi:O-methyltransferase